MRVLLGVLAVGCSVWGLRACLGQLRIVASAEQGLRRIEDFFRLAIGVFLFVAGAGLVIALLAGV